MGTCQSATNHQKRTITEISSASREPPVYDPRISKRTKYDDIQKFYTLGSHIGNGSFGLVREGTYISITTLGRSLTDNKKVAIKTIWKAQFDAEHIGYLINEIEICLDLDHDNIIKCHEIFEDMSCIHFVFDIVESGDLFDYILNSDGHKLSEIRAADCFLQIIDALHYLHSMNIVHRDIKPENFLISEENSKIKLKLIDFGFAVKFNHNKGLVDKLGSPQYIAPEIYKSFSYDNKVDIWAAGVILYNMLSGKQPFSAKNDDELTVKIINEPVNFDYPQFANVTKLARDIILFILNKDPEERPEANMIKDHQWLRTFLNVNLLPTVVEGFQPQTDNIKDILSILNQQNSLRTDIWDLIVSNMNTQYAVDIREVLGKKYGKTEFEAELTKTKNMISYELFLTEIIEYENISDDFKSKIENVLVTKKEICKTQKVNFDEFLDSVIRCRVVIKKEKMWNTFKNLDKKGSGYLHFDQLLIALADYSLSGKIEVERVREIMKAELIENVNKVSFDDFLKIERGINLKYIKETPRRKTEIIENKKD